MRYSQRTRTRDKFELQMTPMIDVVFLLLIFFMLTFKITIPEGNFNINMPLAAPTAGLPDQNFRPEIKVRLIADPAGTLTEIRINERPLSGNTPERLIASLRAEIRSLVQLMGTGDPLEQELEAEIDADYQLRYQYTMSAITACSGQLEQTVTGQYDLVKYIEKIKFAPPRSSL